MAKKEKEVVQEMSPYMAGMMKSAAAKFGEKDGKTHMGEEIDELVIGLPLPSLSLMYLFDSNVFPLGKSVIFAGAPSAQKSSMGFEVLRWFTEAGGYGQINECEGAKLSPSLLRSIVREEGYKRVSANICQSIDEARQKIVWALDYQKKNDPKKTIPFAAVWDSLSGATTESMVEKVLGDEEMNARSFPENALYYSKVLPVLNGQIALWPFTIIGINHLKEKPSAMPGMPPTKTMPGGDNPKFMAGYVFFMERIGAEQRMTRVVDGKVQSCPTEIRKLNIKCAKSSFGTDLRSIPVDFSWYHDQELGEQVSVFDWDGSTAKMLNVLQNKEKGEMKSFRGMEKGFVKGGLADIVDVEESHGTYTSDKLGLSQVSASDLGAAVHANEVIMEQLIDFFHFHRYPVFAGATESKKGPKIKVQKAPMPAGDIPI